MAIADIIKYEGDNSTFIWKHPCEDFNTTSQLIVHESQEAVFFANGQALDLFGAGRHTLETQNIPLLRRIINIPTGGQTPFHCEVYFINKTEQMAIRWGTDSKVQYVEPTYKFPISIGASGEMTLSVKDSRKLLIKLANSVLTTIKTNEPENLHAKYVLEVAEKMNEISLMFARGNSDSAAKEVPDMLILWGDQLEEKFSNISDITSKAADFWEAALSLIIDTYGTGEKAIDDKISQYSEKIKKYHPTYVPPKSKLTYHTSGSPNKLSVTVVKVGHKTFESLPIVGVTEVFKQGPDQVGHIGAEIKLKNVAGRTIKYITVYLTPFNSVGDAVSCTVQGHSTYGISITGPILVGNKWAGTCDGMWYNNTIVSAKVDHVDVTYEDDSMERYTASELTDENAANSPNSSSSGGCYVATCVYGSYDCPQVWTLRRYRDDTLGSTWYGRLFIRTYYAISPTLVKWFGKTNWFKKLWKGKLDRMVAKLQNNGVEDTPYEDKNW